MNTDTAEVVTESALHVIARGGGQRIAPTLQGTDARLQFGTRLRLSRTRKLCLHQDPVARCRVVVILLAGGLPLHGILTAQKRRDQLFLNLFLANVALQRGCVSESGPAEALSDDRQRKRLAQPRDISGTLDLVFRVL
jgi:hypothetical protein